MARIVFTANLRRHVDCPPAEAQGSTVREAVDNVFRSNERLRGYVLDDQSALRRHMAIVVDGRPLRARVRMSDAISPMSSISVLQALSGG